MLIAPSLEKAKQYRVLAMAGTMTDEQLGEWNQLLKAASSEIDGASALSDAAPPVKGSSSAFRTEEILEQAISRNNEDVAAFCLRFNAALADIEAQLDEERRFNEHVAAYKGRYVQITEQMTQCAADLRAAREQGNAADIERLNTEGDALRTASQALTAEGKATLAEMEQRKPRWTEMRRRLDAIRGIGRRRGHHEEKTTRTQ